MEQALLLTSVHILDPRSPWHNRVTDVLLMNGSIAAMGDDAESSLPEQGSRLDGSGSVLSPGWVDLQVHFREPGEETKEGMLRGLQAAAAGGMTAVGILPSTHPCVDHAGAVAGILASAERAHQAGIPTQALPLAHVSEGGRGQQISEMHDMHEAGAVGFTDDRALDRVGLLQRALTYSLVHGKAVMDVPLDHDLNAGGVMHEGAVSTAMGLTGSPTEAETIRIARDLDILRYAGGHLHFSVVTTAEGVELIRQAKHEGLQVTCATTAMHLAYHDEDLLGFVGTLRMMPPLRSAKDRTALRQGILDGTIDAITSDHRPEDLEHHDVEFMLSPDGVASLPSAFALSWKGMREICPDETEALLATLRAWTSGPSSILGLHPLPLDVGAPANLTWFDPHAIHQPHVHTRGMNLPPLPENTLGQVLGTFRDRRTWLAPR